MAEDPKAAAAAAKKKMEELLKKVHASAGQMDAGKLDTVIKEGNSLKNDKEMD